MYSGEGDNINTTSVRSAINSLERVLASKEAQLKTALKLDKKRNSLKVLLDDAESVIEDLKSMMQMSHRVGIAVGQEEVNYKQRRLNIVDNNITARLDAIFPKKGLIAFSDCDFKRNQTRLKLYLKDSSGNLRPPYITEGDGAQQLISYTAAESCLELLNHNKMYLDEAFCRASEQTLLQVQDILKNSVTNGFQIIMISHSSLVYNDVPRREIRLVTDGRYVTRIDEVDFSEEVE